MFLSEWREFSSAPSLAGKKNLMTACVSISPLSITKYRGADKSLARTGEGNKLMFLSEWREFSSAPSLAGKKNLMTAHVSMSPLSIRKYRSADKSLARTGRKLANVSLRMARIFFGA